MKCVKSSQLFHVTFVTLIIGGIPANAAGPSTTEQPKHEMCVVRGGQEALMTTAQYVSLNLHL